MVDGKEDKMPRLHRIVNQDSVINYLLGRGIISRTEIRGIYRDNLMAIHRRRRSILDTYTNEVEPGRYIILESAISDATATVAPAPEPARRRTIERYRYHSQDRDYASALAQIAPDADGVRRSFGLEYEIYTLSDTQEDKLARLLDTLPAHITESDASLGNSGIGNNIYANVRRKI